MIAILSCVNCSGELHKRDASLVCNSCGSVFGMNHGVPVLLPTTLSALTKEEIEHHDHAEEDAVEVHQLQAWRNLRYHRLLWDVLLSLPAGSRLLEIGAGTGFDASHIAPKHSIIITDVSSETVHKTKERVIGLPIDFLACAGERLPFKKEVFDGAYMVATLHHFEKPAEAVSELYRVLKPGGLVVVGIEPNAFYFRYIKKFRSALCRWTHSDQSHGSRADAEMEGFTCSELQTLFDAKHFDSVLCTPMWFLNGYVHYGLEFLFRALRLKKRFQLPRAVEVFLVYFDEFFLKIPGAKHLCWHWIIQARKK